MNKIELKLVGYWRHVLSQCDWPEPQFLPTLNYNTEEKTRITAYLNSGIRIWEALGYSHCRFDCGIPAKKMGCSDVTDGIWLWPEGLVHYIEVHNILLPSDFLLYMMRANWKVACAFSKDELEENSKGCAQFWLDWAAEAKLGNISDDFRWRVTSK